MKVTQPTNLFDYFEQIRVINLDSRKDRKQETEREFALYGFKINTESSHFVEADCPEDALGFPNPGVRGCFLSHMHIIESASNEKANNILILEDDIQFSKHIIEQGKLAIKQLDELDWDIVYFGHNKHDSSNIFAWKPLTQPIQQAHFYAVNGKALEKLTQFLSTILERPEGHPDGGPMHYDGALNMFIEKDPEINAFYSTINLGYQRPSQSDISNESIVSRHTILSPLVNIGRKIKRSYLRLTN